MDNLPLHPPSANNHTLRPDQTCAWFMTTEGDSGANSIPGLKCPRAQSTRNKSHLENTREPLKNLFRTAPGGVVKVKPDWSRQGITAGMAPRPRASWPPTIKQHLIEFFASIFYRRTWLYCLKRRRQFNIDFEFVIDGCTPPIKTILVLSCCFFTVIVLLFRASAMQSSLVSYATARDGNTLERLRKSALVIWLSPSSLHGTSLSIRIDVLPASLL